MSFIAFSASLLLIEKGTGGIAAPLTAFFLVAAAGFFQEATFALGQAALALLLDFFQDRVHLAGEIVLLGFLFIVGLVDPQPRAGPQTPRAGPTDREKMTPKSPSAAEWGLADERLAVGDKFVEAGLHGGLDAGGEIFG